MPSVSATIDTAALRHNLKVARSRAPGRRVMAVIKANAYGHGLIEVARALKETDAFAVARLEEGLALRAAGSEGKVVLLGGVATPEELAAARVAKFSLVVHTEEQVRMFAEMGAGFPVEAWLKFDSGMNRLGFQGDSFMEAHRALSSMAGIARPIGLMTHFASADRAQNAQTLSQLARFKDVTRGLAGERSLANSAAMLNFPDDTGEWVRPGLLLYGVSPLAGQTGEELGLKPVMAFSTRVIAVKDIAAGESVGYGAAWIARRPTRLAIAAAGYGDGYPRSLPSGAPVLVGGIEAKLAGSVSMDMIGIDVTELSRVSVGDPVLLWGPGLPVERVAALAGTISYELLCRISQRVAVSSRKSPS